MDDGTALAARIQRLVRALEARPGDDGGLLAGDLAGGDGEDFPRGEGCDGGEDVLSGACAPGSAGDPAAAPDDVADAARRALIALGPQVLDPLIATVPGLAPTARLHAIEVFAALGDPRPAGLLLDLFRTDQGAVRWWAADALADLGVTAAIPDLRAAYDDLRTRGVAPGDSDAVALRDILTRLGAREAVLPPRAAALRAPAAAADDSAVWPVPHLAAAIADLAGHGHAVLDVQLWKRNRHGDLAWHGGTGLRWTVDRARPWPDVVEHCRDQALRAAERAGESEPGLLATIEWIGAADL